MYVSSINLRKHPFYDLTHSVGNKNKLTKTKRKKLRLQKLHKTLTSRVNANDQFFGIVLFITLYKIIFRSITLRGENIGNEPC